MIKALIFDLDGVIVDTAKYHYLAWKKTADALGIPFDEKDNERLKGVSRRRCFDILLELGGMEMSEEESEAHCTAKNRDYLERIARLEHTEILPGVYAFLSAAREQGLGIALGSASKNSPFILERLGLRSFFDALSDGNRVEKAKPEPDVFLLAAQDLGVAPSQCLVFEDAEAGVEAARRAGMAVVGVGAAEELAGADLRITSFEGLQLTELLQHFA